MTPVFGHLLYWRSKSLSHSKMVHAQQTSSFSDGPDIATVNMGTNTLHVHRDAENG